MKYALLLSSRACDIDALASDEPILMALITNHARRNQSQLPPAWHVEEVEAKIIDSEWTTERVLRFTGEIVPD